jgi:hypothetical protein
MTMMSSSKVVFTTAALRLEHALARRVTSASDSYGFIVRRHLSAAAPNVPKKKSKKTDQTTTSSPPLSYTGRKQAAKQARTQAYTQKLEKVVERQHRRDDAPKQVMKSAFKEWYDARRAWETQMDRKARQSNKEWKIQVAVVLERIPVVLPDQEEWEVDYEELYTYLAQFGKEYPPEFAGSRSNRDATVAITNEELFGAYCTSNRKDVEFLPWWFLLGIVPLCCCKGPFLTFQNSSFGSPPSRRVSTGTSRNNSG